MKTKLAAYVTAAVLMGLAVMMLPLALETTYPASQFSPQSSTNTYPNSRNAGEQQDQLEHTYGLTSPSNVTTSTFILIVGLIFALAAYIIVKKQVNPPHVFSFPYKLF
jgi:hypothetical protein